ncbi:MAG: pyridoxal phosphate-dependent aminotransferase [Planctomycetota bacterium]
MPSQFTDRVARANSGFDFVAAHFECERNAFSKENPTGYVNLGSAQNHLHAERLQSRLANLPIRSDDTHYQPFEGTEACRRSIASYLSELASTRVGPETLIVGNGVISVLEALTVALLDEGDSILVPTPVFPGLVNALSMRVRSRVEYMHSKPEMGFRITPATMEAELHRLKFEGKRVRGILLCSPGNPVGQVFSAKELHDFADIAEWFDCALVVDEIYAGSVFEETRFASAVALRRDHIHVLGGLSKDFGLAGYATGWLQSADPAVLKAVAKQSHFFRLPAPIQAVITSVLEPTWRSDYLTARRRSLSNTERHARERLQDAGIAVSESQAGLCLWLDLRPFLRRLDASAELELYRYLLETHRVHVSPGSGFKTQAPGFYRICFSHEQHILNEGLDRLLAGLEAWRSLGNRDQQIKHSQTNQGKPDRSRALQHADAA